MAETILEVKNLRKEFKIHLLGGKSIISLQEISFDLKRGEFLAITGKSGSGKSTLMKCIYRTYLPSKGRIVCYPKNASPIDLSRCSDETIIDLRINTIGYVSQFFYAIPRVSCLELVAQPLLQRGVSRKEAVAIAKGMLAQLQVSEKLFDAYPSTFSGGEKQRVNIARALVKKVDLLLLDEPTASLDKENRSIVLDNLLQLKQKGVSAIGIFHDVEDIKKFADRLLVLEDGRIKELKAI